MTRNSPPSTPHSVAPAGEAEAYLVTLRKFAFLCGGGGDAGGMLSVYAKRAANEVESLRAENVRLREELLAQCQLWDESDRARAAANAEVERLRGIITEVRHTWVLRGIVRNDLLETGLAPPGSESQKKGDG